jgi:CHAT domain-containing protein
VEHETTDQATDKARAIELGRLRSQLETAISKQTRSARTRDHQRSSSAAIQEALATARSRRILAFADVDGSTIRCDVNGARFVTTNVGPSEQLARTVRSLASLFRRLASTPDHRTETRLNRLLDQLGTTLLGDLNLEGEDIVVLPRGSLALVPWLALPQAARSTVTIAPSLVSWARAETRERASTRRTAILVGPRLDNAMQEASEVARSIPNTTVIDPAKSTAGAALEALQSAETVHFVCHGTFRSDNPLFSQLELADGPLTVHDIFDAGVVKAETVVLSTCSGAEVSARPERAFIGMSGAFLSAGIKSVVASVSPVQDASGTAQFMRSLHEGRQQQQPVRHALATALHDITDPADRLLASTFLSIGAG